MSDGTISTKRIVENKALYTVSPANLNRTYNAKSSTADEFSVGALVEVVDLDNLSPQMNILRNDHHLRLLPQTGGFYNYQEGKMWRPALDLAILLKHATLVMAYFWQKSWQKSCPLYRLGVVKEVIDGKYANIEVNRIHLEKRLVRRCRVDYMTCDATSLTIGNRVIVKYINADERRPIVVGFYDDPPPCDIYLYVELTCSPDTDHVSVSTESNSSSRSSRSGTSVSSGSDVEPAEGYLPGRNSHAFVWDVTNQLPAGIEDDNPPVGSEVGAQIQFPCKARKLTTWYNAGFEIPKTETMYWSPIGRESVNRGHHTLSQDEWNAWYEQGKCEIPYDPNAGMNFLGGWTNCPNNTCGPVHDHILPKYGDYIRAGCCLFGLPDNWYFNQDYDRDKKFANLGGAEFTNMCGECYLGWNEQNPAFISKTDWQDHYMKRVCYKHPYLINSTEPGYGDYDLGEMGREEQEVILQSKIFGFKEPEGQSTGTPLQSATLNLGGFQSQIYTEEHFNFTFSRIYENWLALYSTNEDEEVAKQTLDEEVNIEYKVNTPLGHLGDYQVQSFKAVYDDMHISPITGNWASDDPIEFQYNQLFLTEFAKGYTCYGAAILLFGNPGRLISWDRVTGEGDDRVYDENAKGEWMTYYQNFQATCDRIAPGDNPFDLTMNAQLSQLFSDLYDAQQLKYGDVHLLVDELKIEFRSGDAIEYSSFSSLSSSSLSSSSLSSSVSSLSLSSTSSNSSYSFSSLSQSSFSLLKL